MREDSPGAGPDAPDNDEHDGQPADTPPESVVEEAERLTRQARQAIDPGETAAYREARADLLTEYDYTARVREDEARDVLVLHPAEWVEDGEIQVERIEEIDRGIEIVVSGPGMAEEWAAVEERNRDLAEAVAADHGDPHGATAHALADFAGNHYAKPITELAAPELREFREDYFRRNAWPTADQRDVVEKSVELAFDTADERCPSWRRR